MSDTEQKENEQEKSFFTKNKIAIILILIFILAFGIRGHLLKYPYMFEFDPYWHLRATGYVIQGDLPANDPLGFYGQGGTSYAGQPKFLWYFTAFLYSVFTLGGAYNKLILIEFGRWLPAIFGALICVGIYFLGKEMYNKKTGIVMAIIAATIPAFVYRTMAGFFEEDSLGFLWMVIGFIFFVKALKEINSTKKNIIYSIIAAFFFILMAMTWQMFLLIPLVLIAYFVLNLIYMGIKHDTKQHFRHFIKTFLIIFLLFTVITTLIQGTGWIKNTTSYVTNYLPINKENIARLEKTAVSETDILGATVGEENTGKQFFLHKYNFLLWVPFVVLPLIFFYLIFSKKKDYFALIIFSWLAITTFMAWSKLKFTYTLGIPIALGVGYLFYICYEWAKKSSITIKRTTTIFFIFLILTSIAAGSHFVTTNKPPIDEEIDWQNTLFWIDANTPTDAKIFNWWDYGHWITFFTDRKASTDNTNSHMEGDSDYAMFIITNDMNTNKEILKKYDADYLIADSGYFSRYNSFAAYAYVTTNFSDPKVSKYMGVVLSCTPTVTENTNQLNYNCGGNIFTKNEFLKIPTTWQSQPSQILQGTPVFVYRSSNNNELYIFNAAVNNSTFAKLWFNDPSAQDIGELAYSSGNVRVYKINKSNLD